MPVVLDLAGVRTTQRTFPPSPGLETLAFRPDHVAHRGADSPIQTRGNQPPLPPASEVFFLAPLTFSARLSRSESSVWHPLAHETVHFPINHSQPNPFLPYLARPRAHHDHQHPMQPTKPPEAWTNKDRDARKSTTKKRMGPKAGIGDQTRSS